jgi:hypothetical protein
MNANINIYIDDAFINIEGLKSTDVVKINNNVFHYVSGLSIEQFNPNIDKLTINNDDYNGELKHVIISPDRLLDHSYYHDNFLNPKNRQDFYYKCLAALECVDIKNPYIGSLITLISYRIAESLNVRSNSVDFLVSLKRKYDENIDVNIPISTRWLTSSSTTLAIVLIALERHDEAQSILETLLRKYFLCVDNQLSYWNFSTALIILARLVEKKGNKKRSYQIYSRCFEFSKESINKILHGKNQFVLNMFIDCQKILRNTEVAYHNFQKFDFIYKGTQYPKLSIPINKVTKDFNFIFERFEFDGKVEFR